jgi:hypothetical protein
MAFIFPCQVLALIHALVRAWQAFTNHEPGIFAPILGFCENAADLSKINNTHHLSAVARFKSIWAEMK